MKGKEDLLNAIAVLKDVAISNDLQNDNLMKEINDLGMEINRFEGKILFVGSFSAGKTALLNKMFGTDVLKEDITPETAIATELEYGENEKVIFVKADGEKDETTLDYIDTYNAGDYKKCIYILQNEMLGKLKGKKIVDMPGFDSGLEAHNNAILQYMGEASAYVFVIDVTNGALGKSSINFLKDLREYSQIVKFVITKCDKVTSENVINVRNSIKDTIDLMGYSSEIICTSARDDSAKEELSRLIDDISSDQLIVGKKGNDIVKIAGKEIYLLKAIEEGLTYSDRDIRLSINDHKNIKTKFESLLAQRKEQIIRELRSNKTDSILNDVEENLRSNISNLVDQAMMGQESFTEAVNDILRNTFVKSTNYHLNQMYIDVIKSFNDIASNYDMKSDKTVNTLRETLEGINKVLKVGEPIIQHTKDLGSMYKVFSTGLAVTTTVVAPWLELAIIFLPEIVSFIRDIFGESKEEKLRKEIENNVIPNICRELRPKIEEAMQEEGEKILEAVEDEYMHLIEAETEELEKLEKEMVHRKENYEEKITRIKFSIQKLLQIQNEITASYE